MNDKSWEAFDIICEQFFYPKVKQFMFNPLKLYADKENIKWEKIDIMTTMDVMRYFITKMIVDPEFQEATMRIMKYAPGRDAIKSGKVEFEQNGFIRLFYIELYEWMMKHMQYVHDAIGNEYVRNPLTTLYLASGDCDCFSTAYLSTIACYFTMVGIKGTQFRVILAGDTKVPQHVFPMVKIGKDWFAVDITNKKGKFGWFPKFNNYWVVIDSEVNLFADPTTHKLKKLKKKKIKLNKE